MVRLAPKVLTKKKNDKKDKLTNDISSKNKIISKEKQSNENESNQEKRDPKMSAKKKKSKNWNAILEKKIAVLPLGRNKDDAVEENIDISLDTGERYTFTTNPSNAAYKNNPITVVPSRKNRLRHTMERILPQRSHARQPPKKNKIKGNNGDTVDTKSGGVVNNINDTINLYPTSDKKLREEYGVVFDENNQNSNHIHGIVVDGEHQEEKCNVVESVYSSKYQINDDDSTRSTHRSLRELGYSWWQGKPLPWEHKDPNRNDETRARTRTLSGDYLISRN